MWGKVASSMSSLIMACCSISCHLDCVSLVSVTVVLSPQYIILKVVIMTPKINPDHSQKEDQS